MPSARSRTGSSRLNTRFGRNLSSADTIRFCGSGGFEAAPALANRWPKAVLVHQPSCGFKPRRYSVNSTPRPPARRSMAEGSDTTSGSIANFEDLSLVG
jgi:hypothetical protein